MNKTVIYTAIFGDYDELREPAFIPPGCDFVCLTDRPQRSKIWQIRVINPPIPGDNTRSNRHPKMLAHEYFPEYEYSVYVDGTELVKGDINELIEKYLANANMAAFPHHARDCIYDEAEAVILSGKDDPTIVRRQMEKFRAEGYPTKHGLIASGVLLRQHNKADVKRTMEEWWKIESTQSKRDQLSFGYAVWKQNLNFSYITEGNVKRNSYFEHRRHQKVERGTRALLRRVGRKLAGG